MSQNRAGKRPARINTPAPKFNKPRTKQTRIQEWGLMLPQEEEEFLSQFAHETSPDAQKPKEELVDIPDSIFGDIDYGNPNQSISPTRANKIKANPIPQRALSQLVPISNLISNVLEDTKEELPQENFQLSNYKLLDVSKFPNYKHASPTGRKREG